MRSFFYRLFACFIFLIALTAIFIAALPSIASTDWGRKQIVYWVNRTIPGKIEIQSLALHWGKGQKIDGIELKDPNGKPVFHIEKFSTEGTLWQLLQKSTHLGHTQVLNLNATIDGKNLQSALGIEQTSDFSPIQLTDVNADLYLFSKDHPLSILMNGTTSQDQLNGTFNCAISLPVPASSNWNDLKNDLQKMLSIEGSKEAKLQANISNFPVSLIDQMASPNGLFQALLGDRLNLTIEKHPSKEELAFNLMAQSPLMKGSLNGQVTNGLVSLKEPAQFEFQLTPQFINSQVKELQLLEKAFLKLNINTFSFPLALLDTEANLDQCQIELKTEAMLPKMVVDVPNIGTLSLLNLQAKLQSPCAKTIELQLDSQVMKDQKSFQVHADSTMLMPSQFKNVLPHLIQNIKANIKVSQLPLGIIPQLQNLNEIIGSPIDTQISLRSTGNNSWEMNLFLNSPEIALSNVILKLSANYPFFKADLNGQFALLNPNQKGYPFLSEPLLFSLTSNGKWKDEISFAQMEFHNSLINGKIEGRLSPDRMELSKPANLNVKLTPDVLKKLELNLPNLQEDSLVKLTVQPLILNLKDIIVQIKGVLSVDQIRFVENPSYLKDIVLPWEFNGKNQQLAADLKGAIQVANLSTPFSTRINLQFLQGQFDLKHIQAEGLVKFEQVPTSLLTPLLTQHHLEPLIGPTINLHLKAFYSENTPGSLDLSVNSSNINVQGNFKLSQTATLFDPKTPPSFNLTLTQEGFESLKKILGLTNDLKLKTPVSLKGQLAQFNFPLKKSPQETPALDFIFSTSDFQWQNSTAAPLKLEGRLLSKNVLENIQFSLQTGTPLVITGSIDRLFNHYATFNDLQSIEIQAKMEGKKINSSILQSLSLGNMELTRKIEALFGNSLDILLNGKIKNLSGPIQASIVGPEAQILLDGQLKQGTLTLNKPLEGTLNPTPLFVQTYLAPSVPLLSSAVGSEKPIKFAISPDRFSCPLFPFQLDQVKIGNGMLDLGKIKFKNQGEISSVLSFIHTISDPYFTIWFTPQNFILDKGVLTLKRLDMLVASSYTLASWGSLSLTQQKGDLILGLSGKSLEYAFGIQGLGENYMLQIPVHTENGKVDLDKKKATARITALIAQSKGGVQGKILGNILDAALSIGDSSPPPTQPFPWKDEFKPTSDKKKKQKGSDNPLNEITDGASQVLDLLFGR